MLAGWLAAVDQKCVGWPKWNSLDWPSCLARAADPCSLSCPIEDVEKGKDEEDEDEDEGEDEDEDACKTLGLYFSFFRNE